MLSRDLRREREYKLVQLLEKNIADESEARQGYFAIFQEYLDDLSMDEIWQIKEIIAEELKHTEILQKMVRERTKINAED